MNVIYIPTGRLPKTKAEDHCAVICEKLKKKGYDCLIVPVSSN